MAVKEVLFNYPGGVGDETLKMLQIQLVTVETLWGKMQPGGGAAGE